MKIAGATENDWLLKHLDIKQAYIQVHLDEAVYMKLPTGREDMSGDVVLLQRAVCDSDRLADSRMCGLVR